MTEKYIVYRDGDDIYDIAESDAADFESQYPNATIEMRDGDDIYDISPADRDDFLSQYPNAIYTFDLNNESEMTRREKKQARREEKVNDDRTSWGETAVKSTGSAGVRTGKMIWDALINAAAGSVYIDPHTGIAERLPSVDQMIAEGWDEIEFSKKMGETADRLSREADPTGGEKGFWDLLLKEGKVGKALQKGLATAIESAPATLSAANPYTMGLYLIGNAASKFMDESVENPDIPKEKRAAYAIGSAAFEQAVEKFADPIFKYIGGGKVAKGFTEGAAKEVIEDVTKEATESIAKRIWRVIKNTGKDMLGEGAEEIITGVGTDALGSALDLIEGNEDYGFAAQFEEYKENNPNATKEQFAWEKAKEYADAFIGGALSGGYMSGPVQTVTEFANAKSHSNTEKFVAKYRNYGNGLDYGNMYDTDADVAEASAELEKSFVNENGEATLTPEFLGGLSANDATILSQRGELSDQQRTALANYAEKKAVQEGLEQKLDERTIAQINKSRELIDSATNEDGTIIAGNAEGRNVYVVDAQLENGVVTTPYGNSPVIVIDANTGDKFYVPSNDVKDGRSLDSKVLMGQIEQTLLGADSQAREVARNTMSPRAKIKAIQPFAGKKILVDLGNGTAEVYVQQIDANGNVLIKGKKGDLGGQTFLNLGGAAFYDSIYRDNDGNPVVTEAGPEVEEQVDEAPEVKEADAYDFRDYVGPILINGVPVEVEVTQQDDASDTIVYTYVDENGVTRRGSSSISEFKNAIVKPQEETEVTPEPATVDEIPETPEPTPEVDETPIDEVGEVPAPQPIDWDALFESDKEAFFSELQNYFGENAAIMLEDFIEATQNELDELNKAKVSGFNEIAANREAKAKVQTRLDVLNEMLQRLAPQPVEETPVAETPAPVEEAPAPVAETPTHVEETPTEEATTDATPTEPAPVEPAPKTPVTPVAPKSVANPIQESQKRERSLATQLKRVDISPEQKMDMAFNAGKAIGDLFATREEYEAYAENATDLGEYNSDFERGVDESFANRGQNSGDSQGESVTLETEPKEEKDVETTAKQTEEEGGEDTQGHSDNDGTGRTNDGGVQAVSEGDSEETQVRTGDSGAEESVEDKYPARNGDVSISDLKDTFGFSSITFGFKPSTLNAIYDTMMEVAKMLGISPKSLSHGGTLSFKTVGGRVGDETKAQYGPNSNWRITGGVIYLRNSDLHGMIHEWWHSLDNVLEWWNNPNKNRYTSSVGKNTTSARPEVFAAISEIVKAIKESGHIDRINAMNMWDSDEAYFKQKKEQTARAFEEYILGKLAEKGIVIENIEKSNWDTQPTSEEMKVISPAFDKLFEVLKEKEGKTSGTSVLYHIGEMAEDSSEVKRELGEQVAEWIQQGGNFVVMDSAEMQKALEEEGITQSAKRRRRILYNSDLSRAEKRKIKEYILSLPLDSSFDGPLMLKADGYAYIFNTSVRFFKENTTKKPKGDGFEILHKHELSSLTELDKKLLDATYNYGEDSGNLDEMLQILGINKRGSSDSPSVDSNLGTERGDVRLDEAKYREPASTDRSDNGGRRDSGEIQKLETPDGVIYGFVKDGTVYLDPTLLNPNTSIHEYTHLWDNALMQLNPELWKRGKELLKQTSLWNEVVNDPNYADIKDNEDLVASEVHSRLVGEKGAARLEKLEQEARAEGLTKSAKKLSILGRLREWLNEATQWLKDAFTVWDKSELDALSLDGFLNMPMRDLANFRQLPKEGVITNGKGDVIADNKGKGKIQFSISTWEDGGRDYLVNWLNNDKDLAEDEKADIIARMDEFYENAQKYTDTYVPFGNWSEAAVKYDENGNPLMSVIKKNGDYAMNLDFSLVCKKRRPLNRILRALINKNAFGNYSLKERELAEINWILQEHGFEVACALCFVDSKRYRVTGVADVFAALYNRFVKALAPEGAAISHFNYSGNPNIEAVEGGIDTLHDDQLNWKKFDALAKKYGPKTVEGKVAKFLRDNPSQRRLVDATDFIDANGFESVKESNPALLSLYNSKKGTGGPKASFGDVQYLNDILKKDSAFDVDNAYAVGGVRLQSFSDFVPHMYFDYMQLFAELAAKRLPAHAYTKEVLFAKIFGLSGIKINMSLVPAVIEGGVAPGLDKDGNYAWADPVKDKDGNIIQKGQTFPYDEAMAIQNADGYSKNCGVIAVGISDEQIEKMLDDPNIPFIIPYHKSSLNAVVARMTNIDQYKDYTNYQNTRLANGKKLDKGTKDFNFNAWLREHKGATSKDAAQAYLDWCKENNYKPKFSQFAYHPNYYKLLVDFNTFDTLTGEYAPQGAVSMTFPTRDSAFGDVETLIQQGLQEDADLERKMDDETDAIADEVIDRLKEIQKEPKLSDDKQKEYLAKLADERMEKLRDRANATADEYGDGILSRSESNPITPEMDAEYLAAVEAGDMETAQRLVLEAAKLAMPNTKVLNSEGYPRKAWHGTASGGFAEFREGWAGIFFSDSRIAVEDYTGGKNQDVSNFLPFDSSKEGQLEKVNQWLKVSKSVENQKIKEVVEADGLWRIVDKETGEFRKNDDGSIFEDSPEIVMGIIALNDVYESPDFNRQGIYTAYINIEDPFVIDAEGRHWWQLPKTVNGITISDDYIPTGSEYASTDEWVNYLRSVGMSDGLIVKRVRDSRTARNPITDYVVFNPLQIKSANVVTYDDNGNVIPLSERFNPENPDIRYRTINEGETDLEFVQSAVADFLSQYKSPVPMTAVDVNDRAAVEKAVGFEEGELSDESYKMLVDKVGKGGNSIYIADTKRIIIFADNRNVVSAEVEDSAFHEITHALADKNPAILELGGWLWNNADKGARKRIKDAVISEGYPAEQQHNEMLARFTGSILAVGRAGEVSDMLPAEQKKHWDYILNEIGYEQRKDDEPRARRFADDSRRAAIIRQNYSAKVSDNGDARNAKEARQNEAVGRLVGTARSIAIENAVNEEAAKLGVKVTYKTREEMPKGHKNDKGYFNTKTGEIVVCTENASSISDAIQTILHEAVAHKGLRALMGDRFSEFINRVYESLDDATKAKVDSLAETKYNGNKAVAMEEYMASLAETMDFENKSVWEKIKEAFEDIINKILGRDDIKIGDNELRYILRASYNHMSNPRTMDTIEGWAKDKMMREEYGVNEAQPELMSRTGIDPTEASRETAKKTYDRVVTQQWQEFQRQFQDAMQPVRIAIDAIQQETGNIPIEDYENYLLIQNQSSSRSRVEIDTFSRRYYSSIIEQVNKIVDKMLELGGYDVKDEKKRAEAYSRLKQYLIAKHGLERNKYYQEHNLRKLKPHEKAREMKAAKDAYDEAVRLINEDTNLSDTERQLELYKAKEVFDAAVIEIQTRMVPDLRDYSGLTSLFGFAPKKFKEAEEEAQRVVDEFEIEMGATDIEESALTKALWEKINAATSRTLRHSYESGLLSRHQYNEIKDMFKFYIPLRGFDETTAEDVYSYARFEGNKFNPAVQKAGGRTSVADDPIAIIMNMAESEIAQGNKNRAKQALYNYLLNRPVTDAEGNQSQNTLMQIESVWYLVKEDSNGNVYHEIATPNHEDGESFADFETRMLALEAEDKAYKSKKGKVDIGMRFQKTMDRTAHYIYLKINGVEKAIYVNGDPKAADAVNGRFSQTSKTAQKVKDVNRFISSMFTNYSLEFTVRNFLRDMVYSRINIGVKENDPEYRVQFRKNFWRNNPVNMVGMLKAYRAGEYDGVDLTEEQAAFVEFMNNGGQTGYTLINSVESRKKDLQRAIERMQKGIVKGGIKDTTAFRATLGGIELLNEASELTTRFAAFKTSRDLGRGIHESIDDAKEISVNFNTKGAQDGSSGWMGMIASYFGTFKYFFNASVQGVQNIGAMAQKNKGKFGAVAGSMVAFGALWPLINGAILSLITGDDEDDEYWNIPEYDRQNNFCIALGNGRYVKIALPIGFREMFGIGDMISSAMAGKTPRDPMQWGKDLANKIANIALPINPLEGTTNGLSLIESAEDMLIPDMAQFILQNRTNKDWKGAPIQKEYTYNQDDPQWTKAFSGNPAWITGLSKWCNENIGSDGMGWDWSPEKLDNTLSNVFGGTYALVKKTGRMVSSIFNKEFSVDRIPVVGVFTGKTGEDSFITSTYWTMEDYYGKRLPYIKRTAGDFGYSLDEVFARVEDGEARAGEHHPEMSKIYNRKNFDFMQEWYLGHKGEGDEENLGLDQIKTKIERYKKAAKKDEYDLEAQEMLAEYEMMMEAKRRDLVEDLLELD